MWPLGRSLLPICCSEVSESLTGGPHLSVVPSSRAGEVDVEPCAHMTRCSPCWRFRHGESTWNDEGRFTGWVDVPLSKKGEGEATQCGQLLKDAGFTFDIAYTSVLKVISRF